MAYRFLTIMLGVVAGIAFLYIAASVAAFVAYGVDKSAARGGGWRTPERTLHVLSLIGGWPGALVAQRVFRHKSRKRSFRAAFYTTVAVNCLGLLAFYMLSQ